MNLKLPQELIKWIDGIRKDKSRQAYIVNVMMKLMSGEYELTKKNKK